MLTGSYTYSKVHHHGHFRFRLILVVNLISNIYRYNREEVVRSLGKEVNLNPPLTLGQLPDTPEELLKLDQVFIKSELKVGVIYVKEVS